MDAIGSLETKSAHTTGDDIQHHTKQEYTVGKNDKTQNSFYDCPTAACSIASVSAQQDQDDQFGPNITKAYSLEDIEDDRVGIADNTTIDSATLLEQDNNQPEEKSVSYSALQRARGGYFAGSLGTLYQGSPVLTERPKNFITHTQIRENTKLNEHSPNLRTLMMPACTTPTVAVPEGSLKNESLPITAGVESAISIHMDSPVKITSQWQTKSDTTSPVTRGSATASPAVKDYSRAVECGNTSETSFVHEGYDTIQVPRYRPIEVVDKVVEVPAVHHVDTYVPKKEIQEIESIVKKPYIKYVDKIVEVPEVHYTDKIVEVPEYHEITKTVTKVEVQERVKYMPKVEVKVVPKYVEVPVIKIVDKYEEYEEVEEIIKEVEKVEIVEVPREVVKHVVKPVRKIIEQERIVPITEHRDVPVEKVKFVPKVETVELIREIPKIIDIPVPYNVPKIEYVDKPYIVPQYRDVQVAVPVRKRVTPVYHYQGEPEIVDVPVHKPYFVIHDHITFKPAARPIAENIKVVGARPVDLDTLSEADRQDAQERMQKAIIKTEDSCGETAITYQQMQNSPSAKTQNTEVHPCLSMQRPTQAWSHGMELPIPEMTTNREPQFGMPRTPPSKVDRSKGSIETIIYRNTPRASLSPVSDSGMVDVYPRSNNTTPRMTF
ncbi:uncharacterized protein BXIN_1943 [Babesia sp. Xinjiang]|uniref:uncharacterized protein n=1 Tax=Babesia sp. Xinjiang TaxID=462227 RepID=UPI000A263028|nr:uncharacterized protein BXIN_1943 [Babesia sp. Xinjiang]ORM40505.1 hypothetical protein BXIN_1943 [Babesia sp. Xinjiang]